MPSSTMSPGTINTNRDTFIRDTCISIPSTPSSLPSVDNQPHPDSARPSPEAGLAITPDLDRDVIFSLIDRVLPFEACLYHQVLPLSLVENQLRLGMVDLADASALDYLRKVLAYLPYRLLPQVMPSDLHHQILSGYLKFKAYQESIAPEEEPTVFFERPAISLDEEVPEEAPTVFFERTVMGLEVVEGMEDGIEDEIEDEPTIFFERPFDCEKASPASASSDRHNQETLIVETPRALHQSELNPDAPHRRSPKAPIVPPPALQQFDRSTIIQPLDPNPVSSPKSRSPLPNPPAPRTPIAPQPRPFVIPGSALPVLQVNHHPFSTEQLLALSAKDLLEALLGRILTSGIGRLYFAHQGEYGRVLSSESGIFQTVIEELPIATFNGVIAELKRLTSLPQTPVQQTLQVEIERLYDKSRLLLRLRLIPKRPVNGEMEPKDPPQGASVDSPVDSSVDSSVDSLVDSPEDATLQILQGSALRFYQQQQISNLSRDTLTVARQLQRKVEELYRRSHGIPPMDPDELAMMPELQEVLQNVNQQLTEIERQTHHDE